MRIATLGAMSEELMAGVVEEAGGAGGVFVSVGGAGFVASSE